MSWYVHKNIVIWAINLYNELKKILMQAVDEKQGILIVMALVNTLLIHGSNTLGEQD